MATLLSRELSWLRFNHRVLLQTQRDDIPLLEKTRFLAIFANNQDEFFAARILRTFDALRAEEAGARDEYRAVMQEAYGLSGEASRIYEHIADQLEGIGIHLAEPGELSETEMSYFGAFLAERVEPMSDLLDPASLAELSSRALYLAAGGNRLRYLIRLPESVPRLLEVPGRPGTLVRLGPLVRERSDIFIPEDLPMYEMRITRLASLDLERLDWDDLSQALEERPEGHATRVEVEKGFPWVEELQRALDVPNEAVFRLAPPIDHRYLETVARMSPPRPGDTPLRFPPQHLRYRRKFASDPFTYLDTRDMALYHPLDDYAVVERFVAMAARDPEVDRIQISLYRMGEHNSIGECLIEAARRGKDVSVLLEGRARFDELQNLHWHLRFQEAGIRILPLPSGVKVHAKALLVRRAGRRYLHLGTGNYNPVNGRLYSDISLFSANEDLADDAEHFFEALRERRAPRFQHMVYGRGARATMIERILREGHPGGHVILKMNHLADDAVFEALGAAADSGARIDLIVRSSFTRYDERFNSRSIIGRYLEHPRIAAFRNEGDWEVWAGSADWMPRNFDDRIELIFPVFDKRIRQRIVRLLKNQLADDVNAFILNPDGTHEPRWGGTVNSQLIPL